MLITNQMRSVADYSVDGSGSSLALLALQYRWTSHIVTARKFVIACGLPCLCLPTPAGPLPPGPIVVQHTLLLGPVQALQFLQALVKAMQELHCWSFCCLYALRWRLWLWLCAPMHTSQHPVLCWQYLLLQLGRHYQSRQRHNQRQAMSKN